MLLLDTCTLIWLVSDQAKLSPLAIQKIKEYPSGLYICAASAMELAIKQAKKKIALSMPVDEWFVQALMHHGLTELSINIYLAIKAAQLPDIHADPMDRLLIAAAKAYDLKIITPDQHIRQYTDVECIW